MTEATADAKGMTNSILSSIQRPTAPTGPTGRKTNGMDTEEQRTYTGGRLKQFPEEIVDGMTRRP